MVVGTKGRSEGKDARRVGQDNEGKHESVSLLGTININYCVTLGEMYPVI